MATKAAKTTDGPGYALFDTALGTCAVAWRGSKLARVQLPEASARRSRSCVQQALPSASERKPPPAVGKVIRQLTRHLAGKPATYDSAQLDLDGITPFARKIYQALRNVPAGETVSYGQLALRAGSPKAARAVGRAMATNPFPVVVPCHRVLASAGKAGGFSSYGGLATKKKLLAIEGVALEIEPKPRRRAPKSLFHGASPLPFDAAKARRSLARRDPKLAALMRRVGPFRLALKEQRPTFNALAEAIVYQQLSGKAAATIYGRLLALYDDGQLSPDKVAASSDELLRSAGLSRSKTAALRDLSRKTLAGDVPNLDALGGMDDEAIVLALTRVRGVGRWTVEMLLIFQLGRPDVLPAGDYGVRKGYVVAFGGELPTEKQIAALTERFSPYRTMLSWYLWRATELGEKRRATELGEQR